MAAPPQALIAPAYLPRQEFYSHVANDVDDQAVNLTGWRQIYDQLTPGRFTGSIQEVWLGGMQIFLESTSHVLRQSCVVDSESWWFGIPMVAVGCKLGSSSLGGDTIAMRPGRSQFELLTPNGFQIMGLVIPGLDLERHIHALNQSSSLLRAMQDHLLKIRPGQRLRPHDRFMPRFGFAYRPFNDSKTSIRGCFGIYNNTVLGSSFYSLTGTLQAETTQYSNTYNATTHAIGYQWPIIYAGAGANSNTANFGQDYFGTANSTHWKDPYTEQYTLGVERDLGSGYAMRISYIGSQTHDLVWTSDENTLPFSSTVSAANQPLSARLFPNWGRINTRATVERYCNAFSP